jgi:L-amino acid N-acyltransferase YncA
MFHRNHTIMGATDDTDFRFNSFHRSRATCKPVPPTNHCDGRNRAVAERKPRSVAPIRQVLPDDAPQICEIYNHYIASTIITFEEEPLSTAAMSQRIAEVTAKYPWLVSERNGSIAGYAYATAWKTRSAYRFAVESAIYLKPESTGQGIGNALYLTLIEALRERRFHCVIGGIALPNAASVALHEKLGFRRIGQFAKVGWKFNTWLDVGYWQLILENADPQDGTIS